MASIKGIERLEGRGIKAKVVNAGGLFSTYKEFAEAVGYPGAVRNGMDEKLRENDGKIYDVLAKGKHEFSHYGYVYVLESEEGERFLMGENSIEVIETKNEISEMTNTELERFAVEVITEIKRRAYAEGYDRGKFDGAVSGEYYGERVRKTAQEMRDDIVERAKKDIIYLKRDRVGSVTGRKGYETAEALCDAYFIINKEKRTAVCLLKGQMTKEIYARGIAKCAPNDCFNVHIGKAIALRRARGIEVPDEYLNTPQPTEARVGDIIDSKTSCGYMIIGECNDIGNGTLTSNTYYQLSEARIIDDSREGVDE